MENLKGSVYITPKDIQLILGCHITTARIELVTLREELGKDRITVDEYCQYWKTDQKLVVDCLNKYR